MVQDMFIVLLLLLDAALASLKFYKPAVLFCFFVLGSQSLEKVQLHRTVLFSMKKLKSSPRQKSTHGSSGCYKHIEMYFGVINYNIFR